MESFCVSQFSFDDFSRFFLPLLLLFWRRRTCKLPAFHLQISNLLAKQIFALISPNAHSTEPGTLIYWKIKQTFANKIKFVFIQMRFCRILWFSEYCKRYYILSKLFVNLGISFENVCICIIHKWKNTMFHWAHCNWARV